MAGNHDSRPDPDRLLEQIRGEEQRARRGKLRIYFGASAGVGKTYAMLSAAQREHKAGVDVMVGVLETHGRDETAELLAGLPCLPLREMPYRGRTLKEFDLDAALARKPQVLLVDELAHSNVAGSRHPKRWQDVSELLEAGIDVWSTLNVQHLESLNGTIGAITGVRVHETVPDTVLDEADEVILVDVTPDELIARMKAGKVYMPQQAERAAQNFFRKGNLIALREIALRRTAEHVEDDVRSYRVEQSIAPVWNTEGALLACVGPNEGAEQTVRAAARLAGQLNVRWYAAYVETPELQKSSLQQRDRVLTVIKLASDLGAETAVLAGADVAAELVRQAQALNCATVVVGRPHTRRWPWPRPTLTRRLATLSPALTLVETGQSESVRRLSRLMQPTHEEEARTDWQQGWPRYAGALATCVAITLFCTPLIGHLDLANIVMIFLLGVVLVARAGGRGPAAFATVVSVAAFDFFFVPPRFTFAVSDAQYVVTFAVMLLVGLLTGQLTAGLRFQARISASRERRSQSLFELTRELSAALLSSQVCEIGAVAVQRDFGGQAVVLATDSADQLVQPGKAPEGFDASVADWAFRNGQSAGLATSTLAAQSWHYVPLKAPMRIRGVLALKPAESRWLLVPEQAQQLDTLARQIAIALERVHYVDIAQQAVVEMESERLRNALLAAISHDVRTPLTALIGLAESLRQARPPLPPAQAEGARALVEQARELHSLVDNLLEMARLQSGQVNLRMEWQSVEEAVGAVGLSREGHR
jgi:two-component system sensor histidine kinase KdpD